ncbi:cholinesterase-like [Gigantopelta aegis]|uniref:cholinesterase-like n=1 Tax=Gigantopelta aegis TaxID=1735272 RepID=UPI001B88B253|nr:cholinesterase-like [Gigantopelta aegis]
MDARHFSVIFITTLIVDDVLTLNHSVVNTTLGRMRGFQENILNKTMDVFYGIPFAKPPIGDLRFRRPEELPPWGDSIKDMLEMKASCLQPPTQSLQPPTSHFADAENLRVDTSNKSEDCLYLNIWAPHSAENKIATLVWIHGGAFYSGSANVKMYDGTYLAAANDVIIVALNYRLGPFGFLYTGSDDAPGNQGLLDQTAALKWIHSNIEQFGGNRNKITLFGESAGSVMVNHHLFSPLSRNYFTSAIMESGSTLAEFVIANPSVAKKEATKLATLVGCKKQTTEQEVASCLRRTDPRLIIKNMFAASSSPFPFAPTVDGQFLPDHPRAMLKRGNIKNARDRAILLSFNFFRCPPAHPSPCLLNSGMSSSPGTIRATHLPFPISF